MTQAVLISGTIGAGKTSVAVELGRLLEGRGAGTAVVDLDWLGWVHLSDDSPVSIDDVIVRNLADVWSNLRGAGITHLNLDEGCGCGSKSVALRTSRRR